MATKKKAAKAAPKKNTPVKKAAPAKKKAAAKPASKATKPAPKKAAKPVAKKVEKKPAKKTASKPAAKPASAKVASKAPNKKSVTKPAVMPKKEDKKPETKKQPESKKAQVKSQAKKEEIKQVEAKKPEVKKVEGKKPALLNNVPPPKKPVPAPEKPVKVVIPEMKTKTVRKYEPEFTKSVLDQPDPVISGPTLRYSDTELQEFRELIQKKLDQAKKELTYLQGLITRKDEMGGDENENRYMTMEDGSMSMEREQLAQMASRQINYIDHLEKALMRIENRTYGICRVTGKLIDKARLRAVPHATLSIEAKQMMNK